MSGGQQRELTVKANSALQASFIAALDITTLYGDERLVTVTFIIHDLDDIIH